MKRRWLARLTLATLTTLSLASAGCGLPAGQRKTALPSTTRTKTAAPQQPTTPPATRAAAPASKRVVPLLAGNAKTRPTRPTTRKSAPPAIQKPTLPTGSLSRVDIKRVIRSHLRPVRLCYEKELSKNPTLAGKIFVTFRVDPSGQVGDATIDHSTMQSFAVETCLVTEIRSWVFPRPRGGIVLIKYPFVFRTSGP